MKKFLAIPPLVAAFGLMIGCEGKVETQQAPTETTAERMSAIAGDKAMTADLMRQAHTKGTFDDALSLAMSDSLLAEEVLAAVRSNPIAARLTPTSTASTASRSSSGSGSRSAATPASNKDALDKTEDAVHKANQRIDQAARVKKEAEEAKKKVEGIFK